MPVLNVLPSDSHLVKKRQERLRNQVYAILERAKAAKLEAEQSSDENNFEDNDEDMVAEARAKRDACNAEYKKMIEKTKEIKLQRLIATPYGCNVFSELCLRVDLNQQYASILPQWKDIARELDIDGLKTQWVDVCVRPKEGLTQAILEMYMMDGGTLGDVLEALFKLNCLEILEKIKGKVWRYLEDEKALKERCRSQNTNGNDPQSGQFFSILSTLEAKLGKEDPCQQALRQFSKVLMCRSAALSKPEVISENTPIMHEVLVQGSADRVGVTFDPVKDLWNQFPRYVGSEGMKTRWDCDTKKDTEGKKICRILLMFSDDGIRYGEQVSGKYKGFEHEGVELDIFRLNETTLWYELLANPWGCCMKWVHEADFVMPILTPHLLKEVHCGQDNGGQLLPTSPMINRFIYNQLRAQFGDAGCRNTVVRPIIPKDFMGIRNHQRVKYDPLFRYVWIPEEGIENRLKSMMQYFKNRMKDS